MRYAIGAITPYYNFVAKKEKKKKKKNNNNKPTKKNKNWVEIIVDLLTGCNSCPCI